MSAAQPLSRMLRQGHWRSATAALALVGLIVGAVAVGVLRSEVGRSLAGVARSTAFNADVAVIFEDAQAAAELLRLVAAQERLASIEIVLTDGRVLARWRSALAEGALPPADADFGEPDACAPLRAACGELGLPALCRGAPALAEQLLRTLLWHLDRPVSYTHLTLPTSDLV